MEIVEILKRKTDEKIDFDGWIYPYEMHATSTDILFQFGWQIFPLLHYSPSTFDDCYGAFNVFFALF